MIYFLPVAGRLLGGVYETAQGVEMTTESQRTRQQNNALHKGFTMLAETLNDSGYDMKAVLAVKEVDVPWTGELVKKVLYSGIMEAMTGKDSTADLTTKEVSQVWEVLTRHLGDKLGVVCPPFPHEDE